MSSISLECLKWARYLISNKLHTVKYRLIRPKKINCLIVHFRPTLKSLPTEKVFFFFLTKSWNHRFCHKYGLISSENVHKNVCQNHTILYSNICFAISRRHTRSHRAYHVVQNCCILRCGVHCVCVLFSASRYNVGLMQRTCTNSKVKWICKTIFQRNKIFVGIQYWQNIIVDVIYIKKIKKKKSILWFCDIFFISILYKKKKHSLYAVCQCLTEKAWRLHCLVNSRWLWRSRWQMGRKLVYLNWKVSIHRT